MAVAGLEWNSDEYGQENHARISRVAVRRIVIRAASRSNIADDDAGSVGSRSHDFGYSDSRADWELVRSGYMGRDTPGN